MFDQNGFEFTPIIAYFALLKVMYFNKLHFLHIKQLTKQAQKYES